MYIMLCMRTIAMSSRSRYS